MKSMVFQCVSMCRVKHLHANQVNLCSCMIDRNTIAFGIYKTKPKNTALDTHSVQKTVPFHNVIIAQFMFDLIESIWLAVIWNIRFAHAITSSRLSELTANAMKKRQMCTKIRNMRCCCCSFDLYYDCVYLFYRAISTSVCLNSYLYLHNIHWCGWLSFMFMATELDRCDWRHSVPVFKQLVSNDSSRWYLLCEKWWTTKRMSR